MNIKNHKSSNVKMITPNGKEHMFKSIADAAEYANANAWTMSLKMEVKGYFEDAEKNKYYRMDKMKTKNKYNTSSAKVTHKRTKKSRRKISWSRAIVVDGVKYDSITEAEQILNIKKDTFGQALRNGRNTALGHIIQYADELPQFKTNQEIKQPIVDYKPETKTSIIVETDDPVIQLINERIVKILKDAGVYEEIKKLSEAIAKLSK